MPATLPVRNLGQHGVRPDTESYDNQFASFTMGVNARFEDNRIKRGPVFTLTGPIDSNPVPRFAFSYKQLSGTTQLVIANKDGSLVDWSAGGVAPGAATETNVSISGYTPNDDDQPFTTTELQDVVYVNRADRVPWYRNKATGTAFAELPNVAGNGWDPSWRCAALREVAGALVAINVTKGATAYPTMVKTSDFPAFGVPPAEWVGTETNSATENVISDLAEPLIDGYPLRDRMILYSANECWEMAPTYDNNVFAYRRLFSQATSSGCLNQNCVAEYNNTHYVFGSSDIWAHDGYSRKSLAAGICRDFIFGSLDLTQSNFAFVRHNPRLNELMFCYVSTDPYCAFPNVPGLGCNRAAVFNYRANTWYFYDLPYVTGMSLGPTFTGSTWASLGTTLTWSQLSGSWDSLGDSNLLGLLSVGSAEDNSLLLVDAVSKVLQTDTISKLQKITTEGVLTCAVRGFDSAGSPFVNGKIDATATQPVFVENKGIDLDVLQTGLQSYKVVKAVYPEGKFTPEADSLYFSFASKDGAGAPDQPYSDPQPYDGDANYKLDFRSAGRFINMQITYNGIASFTLSGLDVAMETTGRR